MCVCFSVGYDDHKVSLGCRSPQPAAVEATLPLSHEMSWQAARGATHNSEPMMLIARTHKTPRKMLTQHQHVLLCRGTYRPPPDSRCRIRAAPTGENGGFNPKLLFPLRLLLPAFTSNGGQRGQMERAPHPAAPSPQPKPPSPPLPCTARPPSSPPFPDVCILIILAPWLAPCTLFTHSSIHIHLACTCLVPTRVT